MLKCDIDQACGTLPCTEGYKCEHLIPDRHSRVRVLFINTEKARCSIYESGLMIYNALATNRDIDLHYMELKKDNLTIPGGYDVYAFNYHPIVQDWLDVTSIRNLNGFTVAFVLEVARDDPFVMVPETVFDAYCAIDPTIESGGRVYAFPRPLEKHQTYSFGRPQEGRAVIGSFGFPTAGKGFEKVVDAVNKEFDSALVRINIPNMDFTNNGLPDNYAAVIEKECKKRAKAGVTVEVTHDYMTKPELVQWCADNTLNVFLYSRNIPGLAATTDQAISSSRPLAISTNDTFRHIHPYLTPYPCRSLKESIIRSMPEVYTMQKAWSQEQFGKAFSNVLAKNNIQAGSGGRESVSLDAHPAYVMICRAVLGVAGRGVQKCRGYLD